MTDIEFAWGTSLEQERDRSSDLPIVRNGPPGTFVILGKTRISLPTDQIVRADASKGHASVSFGGMAFHGAANGRLIFTRVRELHPEHELSPDRSHTMLLDPEWVAAVAVNEKRVWPEAHPFLDGGASACHGRETFRRRPRPSAGRGVD